MAQLQTNGCPESLYDLNGKAREAPLWPIPLLILRPVLQAILICIFAMAGAQPDHK